MKLAIFDVDGTLTLGDGLGTRCFFDAFQRVFGPCEIDCRLTAYRESTDAGIALEALASVLGAPAGPAHVERFKDVYLASLAAEIARAPQAYRPVPGAQRVLPRLAQEHGWSVAIATGNWRRAALLKLATAGVETGGAVGAYSEDGHTRVDVLTAAIGRVQAGARGDIERVVYVGDQPWDKAAADAAGVAFVGIGSPERAARLQTCGARVLDGYERFDDFVAALEQCAAPARVPAAAALRPAPAQES
ncbi:MAG TPA: HAD family hydrolase [Candidatus Limnocylindrales bacterium]|nr:HAD family hydrolase [Candidatus Limnocylindrales bacterium]